MKIIGKALTPLFWGFRITKLAVTAVANRIFLETYTFYHSLRRDEIYREIENLDKAIAALESGDIERAKNTVLPELIKHGRKFLQGGVTEQMVLEALKTHRFSISHMWKGVQNNETLIQYISDYITPADSPLRPQPPPRTFHSTPTRLVFAPELIILPDTMVEEIKRQLQGSDLIISAAHPLQFFHTVRCQPALHQFLSNKTFLPKLVGYVDRAQNLNEYVEAFAERYHIDQNQLEAHIREKKWKEFVTLCLP